MSKKIRISNANKHEFEAELVLCFEVPEIDEKYIIYSFSNNSELSTINVGKLKNINNNTYTLEDLNNDAEWTFIKKVMFQIIKDGK